MRYCIFLVPPSFKYTKLIHRPDIRSTRDDVMHNLKYIKYESLFTSE